MRLQTTWFSMRCLDLLRFSTAHQLLICQHGAYVDDPQGSWASDSTGSLAENNHFHRGLASGGYISWPVLCLARFPVFSVMWPLRTLKLALRACRFSAFAVFITTPFCGMLIR